MATDVRRSCKSSLQWFPRYLLEHATRRRAKLPYTAQVQCGTARWRAFGLLQAGRLFIMHRTYNRLTSHQQPKTKSSNDFPIVSVVTNRQL